jgi:hypothetical protein
VKERPIIFSAPMVRAILEGRKTQTRRIVKPQPVGFVDVPIQLPNDHLPKCPYGSHGDRLWVREAFWARHDTDSDGYRTIDCGPCLDLGEQFHPGWEYCATPECASPPIPKQRQRIEMWTGEAQPGDWWLAPPENWDGAERTHRRNGTWMFLPWGPDGVSAPYSKHSPIFMPRWMSRITLEVTGVRVERLQAITNEDAKAEGVDAKWPCYPEVEFREGFRMLWDTINGGPWKCWEDNPWVWVVEFKRVAAERRAA